MALVWWFLVRMLSRADMRVVWQRCVVLMVAPLVAFAGGTMIGQPFWPLDLLGEHHALAACGLLFVATVLLAGAIYGLGRFIQAIVGAKIPPESTAESGGTTDCQESSSGSMTRMCRQRPWRKRPQ